MPTIKNTQKQNFSSNVVIGNGTDVVEGLTVYGNISTNGNSYTSGLTAKSIYSDNVKFDQLTANNILGPALTAIAPTFVKCFDGITTSSKIYTLTNGVGNNTLNYLVFIDGNAKTADDDYGITETSTNYNIALTEVPEAGKQLTVLGIKNGNVSLGNTANPVLCATDYAPIGTVMHFARTTPPAGWLVCDGGIESSSVFPDLANILGTTFGTATVGNFRKPDLRGVFIRGYDDGRGLDPSRDFGAYQEDEFKSHAHMFYDLVGADANNGGANGRQYSTDQTKSTSVTGGSETRPKNVALLPCIKAYHSYALNTVPTNITTLANNYVTKGTYESDHEKNLNTTGYQKMPGGLIMQWGTTIFTSTTQKQEITFSKKFTQTPFNVTTTVIRDISGTNDILNVYWDKQNTTNEKLYLVADRYNYTGAVTATYMAIGI